MELSTTRLVLLFLVVFVVINTVLILAIDNRLMLDAKGYHVRARKVYELGEFYPHRENLYDTYIRPSLYINTLAGIYRILGPSVMGAKILNVLLSIGSYLFLLGITTSLFGKKKMHFVVISLLYMGYVNISLINLLTLTEPLFLFVFLGAFFVFLKIVQHRTEQLVYPILSGLFMALAILTRPLALLTALCFLAALVAKHVRFRCILFFMIPITGLVVMYGWNAKAKLGKFNAWGTTAGYNLLIGNNPYANGKLNSQAARYVRGLDVSGILLSRCQASIPSLGLERVRHASDQPPVAKDLAGGG